jgi:hypothetical protein
MAQDVTVQAGDVLLFKGDSWISRAIRWFDRSEVNHAAIALDGAQLAEATGHGLDKGQIGASVDANILSVCRRLERTSGVPDMAPVLAVANGYLGDHVPYAYHQIVLLAILATTRQIPLPWVAKRLVRSALDHAADVIGGYLDGDRGTRFMICSEYVYRCYDEASPGSSDIYNLRLELGGAAPAMAVPNPPGVTGVNIPYLQWALAQDTARVDAARTLVDAGPVSFAAGVNREGVLESQIQEYAVAAAAADPMIAADLAETPASAVEPAAAIAAPEPTPEELLAAHIRLARALEQVRDDPEPLAPAGVSVDVLRGLLKGLVNIEASPNFVTPGDLLVRAQALNTVGQMEG